MRRINKKKTKQATHFSLPFESLSNRHKEVFNECLSLHDCCQDVVEDSANDRRKDLKDEIVWSRLLKL